MDWGQRWGREISLLDVLGEHTRETMTKESMNIRKKNQWQSVFKKFIYIVSKEIRNILQGCEIPSWFSHVLTPFSFWYVLRAHLTHRILLGGFYIGLIER